MKEIIIKYGIYLISIIIIVFLLNLLNKQSKQIRDLKDIHTSELYQIDSLQQVHEVTTQQFKKLILSKDSTLNSELEKKNLKIKQLNNIIKTNVNQTIIVKDTLINNIKITRDTIFPIVKKIECLTIYGKSEILNNNINLTIDSLNFNFTITVFDYYDIIYWYNFKKRKEYGYNLIGFRNHYINKTTASSDCFGDKIKIQLYKIKK